MRRFTVALAAVALAGSTAVAEQPGSGAHGHAGLAGMSPHQVAQYCSAEFDKVVAEGRGFGLAFAADQNGYPGPLHILELKELLHLTPQQEAAMRARVEAMFAESRPNSQRLLEAEQRLRRLFADGTATETTITIAVNEAERARRDLRLVHLKFHLGARAFLTEEQRRAYHVARWGAR